jgi:hypothetical protein
MEASLALYRSLNINIKLKRLADAKGSDAPEPPGKAANL